MFRSLVKSALRRGVRASGVTGVEALAARRNGGAAALSVTAASSILAGGVVASCAGERPIAEEFNDAVRRLEDYVRASKKIADMEAAAGPTIASSSSGAESVEDGDTAADGSTASNPNLEAEVSDKVVLALCQMAVGVNKGANIENAGKNIAEAANGGAQIVTLPECWNSPYGVSYFPKYAEVVPGLGDALDTRASPSIAAIIEAAKANNVYVIGGSIPERDLDTGKLYNTSVVVSPQGEIVAKHRKVHLFDIDVPGQYFKESDSLDAGDQITTFSTPHGTVGLGICYDLRFAEMSQIMRQRGCKLMVFPAAFNVTTGPPHWELLLRGRALDNQCYVAACSPARDPEASYQAYGHSTVTTPWGEVLATTGHKEAILYATIDMATVEKVRTSIPISKQKRNDMYVVKEK